MAKSLDRRLTTCLRCTWQADSFILVSYFAYGILERLSSILFEHLSAGLEDELLTTKWVDDKGGLLESPDTLQNDYERTLILPPN